MQNQQTTRQCQNPGLPPDPPCTQPIPEDKRPDALTHNSTCGRTFRRAREFGVQSERFWAALAAVRGRPFHFPRETGSKRRALSRTPYRGTLA